MTVPITESPKLNSSKLKLSIPFPYLRVYFNFKTVFPSSLLIDDVIYKDPFFLDKLLEKIF